MYSTYVVRYYWNDLYSSSDYEGIKAFSTFTRARKYFEKMSNDVVLYYSEKYPEAFDKDGNLKNENGILKCDKNQDSFVIYEDGRYCEDHYGVQITEVVIDKE